MPKFRLHLEWDDDYVDRATAKSDLREIWEEIEHLGHDPDDPKVLQVFDVMSLPACADRRVPEEVYLGNREPITGDLVPFDDADEPPQDRLSIESPIGSLPPPRTAELCPVCGQPDNCGDCDHTPPQASDDE
jgi:hypothetical protein